MSKIISDDVIFQGDCEGIEIHGESHPGAARERAKITPPQGIAMKELSRCRGCGGLVTKPCVYCRCLEV